MPDIPTTSPFATEHTNSEDVKALIAEGLEHMKPNGVIEWSELDTEIGYSRGWLIVRRAWFEVNNPSALVQLPTDPDPGRQQFKQQSLVVKMRDQDKLSWGDISVRLGVPESRVRSIYRGENGTKKDLGLRIGKGGRFAYDDPTLYLDNRKKEGAHIPLTKKGRPLPNELLNYIAGEEKRASKGTDEAKRRAMKGVITKLQRKADDRAVTPEERESLLAKIAELKLKYGVA